VRVAFSPFSFGSWAPIFFFVREIGSFPKMYGFIDGRRELA